MRHCKNTDLSVPSLFTLREKSSVHPGRGPACAWHFFDGSDDLNLLID